MGGRRFHRPVALVNAKEGPPAIQKRCLDQRPGGHKSVPGPG
eukprot:CAMPEP_0183303694 /NCGR_PEP_ID=MMETSP0160_2-20130417/9044_1 /TAXON_ID=2839 ORGANISM="Odontella Sinensis, Strain Grunow 1884" /NCGR_SAMPLE_ID=MMETSP0160_2 /ASSEMBLY_ACC=CAM_ASM_000250 /LENGTH=41 /DNA_ID= /DNA_START= /DNA_END= /DNA_ORIENTATION=